MAGESQTYFIVRFDTKRLLPDGRKLSFPSYYKSKGKDVPAPHHASFLDEDTAKQIASFYPDKSAKIIEESGYLNDNEQIHTTLESVGESVSAQELESTIRAALRSLSKAEVNATVKRALA